jgi:hypothetical protein
MKAATKSIVKAAKTTKTKSVSRSRSRVTRKER